jgi:hypothetical protein
MTLNEFMPLLVALIAGVVGLVGYMSNSAINRQAERRRAYAEALVAIERYKQLPYDIHRRPDASPETRRRIAEHISDAVVGVAFHRRLLMLDSEPIGYAYNQLLGKVVDKGAAYRRNALARSPVEYDADLEFPPPYNYEDRDERNECLRVMRRELSFLRSVFRSR